MNMSRNKRTWAREAAATATKWWYDAIANGRIARVGDPDDRVAGDVLAWLGLAGATGVRAAKSNADRFAVLLYDRVLSTITDPNRLDWGIDLSVDYGPEDILADVAYESGIRGSFPVKTRMVVSCDRVYVACGYRAPTVVLFDKFCDAVVEAWRAHSVCPECGAPWREKHFDAHGAGDPPANLMEVNSFDPRFCSASLRKVGCKERRAAWVDSELSA